jgi:hypothetical protein
VDLAEPIGVLACKVPPSVNLTATMSSLTGLLSGLTLTQLKALPDLISVTLTVDPAALQVRARRRHMAHVLTLAPLFLLHVWCSISGAI